MRTIPAPPPTRREDVVDEYHGTRIVDPYRWLEDAESPETAAWVDAQNAYTRSLLDTVPGRKAIGDRLAELLSIGVVAAPSVRGNRYFYQRRDGRQNQPVLYLRDEGADEERVLLDPNAESDEGTVVLDWWYPSWDGSKLAYGYSQNGDEWSTLFVLDVESGERLPDTIGRARYASVGWLPDGSGFYYTRYPFKGEVPEGEENYHRKAFFHTLGTDPATDPLIFGEGLDAEDMLSVQISSNGRWLLMHVFKGWESCDVYLRDLDDPNGSFVPVAVGHDALFDIEIGEDTFFIMTNLDAPRYRVCRVEAGAPAMENWQEIIPQSPDAVLQSLVLSGGKLVCDYLHNATSQLAIFEPDGSRLREVPLPTLGTVTAISGRWETLDAFYSFESFTVPSTVYRFSTAGGESALWASIEAPIRPDEYEVRQVWYTSRDGTRVSMFIVSREELDRSRPHPTVLTGYGGFNLSRTPLFARGVYLWLESGGVYALPNLRGGSEYGEEWHRGGMLNRKQNVFDDFLAAAEYLIAEGYTDSSSLGIYGGSNGGLLVGAALTQRPDLFRAVVCSVPLLDMLRYHHFLIARLWISEYGSAGDPDQFPFLYAYSPYHHVQDGTAYPAILLETAESDTRVDPLHARKMTALLQAANRSDHPILLRVEIRAGHGIGKPLTKIIEEQTDFWSFLFWQLGVSP